MSTDLLFDQSAHAIMLAAIFSLIPLGACLVIGVLLSIFQAATQIQDQTLSFVPKLLGAVIVFWLASPYLGNQYNEFLSRLFQDMGQASGTSH